MAPRSLTAKTTQMFSMTVNTPVLAEAELYGRDRYVE